jgi:DNA-binding MarR family transcriptional regulator
MVYIQARLTIEKGYTMSSTNSFVKVMQEWTEVFMRHSMRNFLLYSKKTNLSMPQIGALFRIHKTPSGVSDLGDELGITPAAASQMLERLFQQKLVLRSEDPDDRRAKQIVLTEKGRQVLDDSMHARQSWLDDLAILLSDSEKKQVIAALDILIKKANQTENNPGLHC